MNTRLDHIVVAARDLESGADYIEKTLGVQVPDGGRHEMMATHNKVMTLGNDVYLEVVAINPEMTPPRQPRWFGLDDPAVIASLQRSPRLLTWAVNTDDLTQLVAGSNIATGSVQQAERGDLRWKVALTDDGRLSAGGFFPLCIQWQTDFHPSTRMADLGCRLVKLDLVHPYPDWLSDTLESIGADHAVTISGTQGNQPASIRAHIESPTGQVILDSTVCI